MRRRTSSRSIDASGVPPKVASDHSDAPGAVKRPSRSAMTWASSGVSVTSAVMRPGRASNPECGSRSVPPHDGARVGSSGAVVDGCTLSTAITLEAPTRPRVAAMMPSVAVRSGIVRNAVSP
jgi:hypothetical protein